ARHVELTQIARIEPAVLKCLVRCLRLVPIMAKQIWPANPDRTNLARGGWRAVIAEDFQFDARQRPANGTIGPRTIEWQARDNVRLGHAITIDYGSAKDTFELWQNLRPDRGGAAREEPHALPTFRSRDKLRFIQQSVIDRRHRHEHRAATDY